MGRLGDIKRYLQRILLDRYDCFYRSRERRSEIKKFQAPRRITIWSKVNLTNEQKNRLMIFSWRIRAKKSLTHGTGILQLLLVISIISISQNFFIMNLNIS